MMRSFLVPKNHPDVDSATRRQSLALHQITPAVEGQEKIGLESEARVRFKIEVLANRMKRNAADGR
jgi:hypothetical protein